MAEWGAHSYEQRELSRELFLEDEGNRVEHVATTSGTTSTTTSYISPLEEVATGVATTTTTAYYGGSPSATTARSATCSAMGWAASPPR